MLPNVQGKYIYSGMIILFDITFVNTKKHMKQQLSLPDLKDMIL